MLFCEGKWNEGELEPLFFASSLHYCMGFPGGSVVKNPPAKAGNTGVTSSIPGSGRCPAEGNDDPLQYSGLENSMNYISHGVAKSWT